MNQYDDIAEQFSSSEREDHPLWKKMYTSVGRMIERRSLPGDFVATIVADLGCGTGRFGKELLDNGWADLVIGFDSSMEMLRIGTERGVPGLSFVKQDVFEKFPEQWCCGLFDFVTAYNVVQCVRSEGQLQIFFRNISRLLRMNVGRSRDIVQFVIVLIDPEYPIPENRVISKWIDCPMVDGSRIHTTLYGMNGREICSFQNHYWGKEAVEMVAESVGLGNLCWHCPLEFRGTSLVIFSGGRVS